MGLHKVFKIIAIILGVAGVAFFVNLLVTGNETIEATGEGVDGYMYLTYAILVFIILMVLLFVLKGIFSGNIKKTLLVLAGFVGIIVVAYVLADGEVNANFLREGETLSESASKWVGTGLYAFYIMALLAIAAMVWTGVTKLINR
ncbi:MAG: hypothetical protein MK211_09300 [Flavobacteriales bacterium]|jgi:hypothetical protein|uniref:hypothetical protein n=1 Tax=Candidatus Ulvibacter alkanivorans TaxID=2267620 RepID=UPI000DF28F86|nr:hypothetical protein [Candidatus Ulvibacter alkanivorans]MCH2490331.1 hypothetical protein [Flavobacteriales bacterium]